ncbi:preprotein translocase subunit SecG [Helicobacter cetorum]|uniref:preprotein translocase subunit SecG n=1 Tax=Helicobacter cetorum TaxID=138563 RepID=UPI0018F837F7|nr:preprotein translocase subunit SecG [Helicobacter cetorum]
MTSVLFWLQIVLAVLIVIVVLLQKSSSIGLGAYSGSNDSLFGAKGPASFMAKLTMFLGLLFVINTITLGYSYNKEYNKSILDDTKTKKELSPLVPSSGSLKPLETPTNSSLNPLAPKTELAPSLEPTQAPKQNPIETPKPQKQEDLQKETTPSKTKSQNSAPKKQETKNNKPTPTKTTDKSTPKPTTPNTKVKKEDK